MIKRQNILVIILLVLFTQVWGQDQEEKANYILITNANVFDGKSNQLKKNQSVLIENNLIKQIGTGISAPAGSEVINADGRTLTPGFIDGHVHLSWNTGVSQLLDGHYDYLSALTLVEAKNTLMRGFTTVRDVGGQTFGVSQAIDEGLFVGPRIYSAGASLSMTSGHADFRTVNTVTRKMGGSEETEVERLGLSVLVDGVDEVLIGSRMQFRKGAHFLKMLVGGAVSGLRDPLDISEFSYEEVKAAADEAKRWNTYLAVHAYTDGAVKNALEAGAKTIEHGNLMTDETMKLLADKGAYLSPQTSVYLVPFDASFSDAQRARQKEAKAGLDNMMKLAKKHNVLIGFGTDLVGSLDSKAQQLFEFTNRLNWFSPVEILKQATSNTAKIVALSGPRNPYGKLGVIEEGAMADLLLIKGNPLENLEILTKPEENLDLIMKDGKIYKNTLNK